MLFHLLQVTGQDQVKDRSNYNSMLTHTGLSPQSDSFYFNDDSVTVTDNRFAIQDSDFMLSWWMRCDSASGLNQLQRIFVIGDNNTTGSLSVLWNSQTGNFITRLHNQSVNHLDWGGMNHADGNWRHYVLGRNSTVLELWIDGVKGPSAPVYTPNDTITQTTLTIGDDLTLGTSYNLKDTYIQDMKFEKGWKQPTQSPIMPNIWCNDTAPDVTPTQTPPPTVTPTMTPSTTPCVLIDCAHVKTPLLGSDQVGWSSKSSGIWLDCLLYTSDAADE